LLRLGTEPRALQDLGAIPTPDRRGVLPAAPEAEAPEEWHVEVPEPLGRG